jgi:hypothetical protein
MRKTNPLTKLRFKPQVSAAFGSVSIRICASHVQPQPSHLILMVEIAEHCVHMPSKLDFIVIGSDVAEIFDISPAVGDCDVVRVVPQVRVLKSEVGLRTDCE